MSPASVTLRPADDLDYVERLLAEAGLPSADVRAKPDCFYVARDGDDPVGVGGVESFDTDGLLRSVVVEPSQRGEGYGTALVEALEAESRESGIETLYLLTTTAAEFFAARGYAAADREAVPDAVRETAQFDELCPASAACMRKRL